jgi:phosphate starvation-inducible PhoH-like protein
MIINGDPTQIDLPPGQRSGLIEAVRILDGVEGVARITFKEGDVVRHDLVRRIVAAYDKAFSQNQNGGQGGREERPR